MGDRKKIGSITIGVIALLFGAISIYYQSKEILIQTDQFVSIGKKTAPVEVVLIEDFQCKNCRIFSRKVIPRLKEEYIRSGKVRFTLVPVSFLQGSQMIANAVLEVKKQKPSQFFSFLQDVLDYPSELKKGDLLRLARRVRGLDIARFERCIDQKAHQEELDQNLVWAQKVMGSSFRTPALYVNGQVGSTYSFEAISYQIEQILEKL